MIPDNALPKLVVPKEFVPVIDKTGLGRSIDEKLRISLAIGLFVERSVTLEKAAQLAGKPLAEFIKMLQDKKIPWMEYTAEHVEEDSFAVSKFIETEVEQ